ncbi:diguanylate cyclase domain-containing protein [Thiorhodococcus minor]|uniref:Diguanylate cyclase n=1 Tax=Thiorhodococcus minor TaxID=57489 RepID=A0A6M0JVS3_9GAMM|nr:diguanylate cyclase [Thiorhodococcus minor]NEV60417.1 diguanylate cyclase [Thiorhodococcus minor]
MSTASDKGLVKLAQYLAGISAHQAIWPEIANALVQLLGIEVAAVGERDPGGKTRLAHWSCAADTDQRLRDDHQSMLLAAMDEVRDSGFFTSRRLMPEDGRTAHPWELLFLPMMRGNQVTAVLLIGAKRTTAFTRQELDFHLAIAGLAAVTAERLIGERELQQHRAHLEELVAQRSGELLESNRRLHQEVAQRQQVEVALRAEKDNLLRILEAMDDFVLIVGPDHHVQYRNPAIKTALGDGGQQLCHELLSGQEQPCSDCRLTETPRARSQRVEWQCATNGRIYDRTMTELQDITDGEFSSTLVILRDITERKRSEEQVRQMAYHDDLTGLPNRLMFQEQLRIELSRAERNGTKLALFMLDLDKFKAVNDTLGHHAGDQLLREASQRMRAQIRGQDILARTGGDEFMLILPDLHAEEGAIRVAAKLVDAFAAPFALSGTSAHVTASIGIALYPDQGLAGKVLIENADRAMYEAKHRGRSGYWFAHDLPSG